MQPRVCAQIAGPPEPSSSCIVEPASPRSTTENDLARSVTGISRQLLETFAFSQVDQLVADVAHMRHYLLSKFLDPIQQPLDAPESVDLPREKERVMAEYKGALYGQQCLESQQVILEYLLGKCLEQCRACLDELRSTDIASRTAEQSRAYILRFGKSRGIVIDTEGVRAQSAQLFRTVRKDFCELAEELRDLDDSRKMAAQFLRDPGSVLPLS